MAGIADTAAASGAGALMGGPVGAALPWIFKGASLLGGLFGKKKKKIDPNWLAQHMGPAAQAARTQEIANHLLNSPYGQKLLTSASEQGSQFANAMQDRAAAAGLTPDTGGQSAASDFTTSAAQGAGAGFKRGVESDIYTASAPVADSQLNNEYQAYLANLNLENSQPSLLSRIGDTAGQVAAMMPPRPAAPEQVAAAPRTAAPNTALAGGVPPAPAGVAQFQMPQAPLAPQSGYVARMLSMQNPALRMTRQRRRGGLVLGGA